MAHSFSLQFPQFQSSHCICTPLPHKLLHTWSKSPSLISTIRCCSHKINGDDDGKGPRINCHLNGEASYYQQDLAENSRLTSLYWDASSVGKEHQRGLVRTLKENGNEYTWGNVTVKVAEIYRFFCGDQPTVQEAIKIHKKRGYTTIIHGDASHEETTATTSIAGKYIIVNSLIQAREVCGYFLGVEFYGSTSTKEEFLKHFGFQVSEGFDPDFDLIKVGVAGQPTMYRGETEEIGTMFMMAMMYKYGVQNLNKHFYDATQHLQAAKHRLLEKKLDCILVIGGMDSSNTLQIQEIAELKGIPWYWIENEKKLGPGNKICYKNGAGGEHLVKEKWIPAGPITVGVIPGATTTKAVESILMKVFEINHKETMWFE